MKTLWLALVLFSSCTKAPETTTPASSASSPLLAEARRALAERERRLTSFQLVVDTREGDQKAHHEFAFRGPNKSRGRMTAPQDLELAFDGAQLVKLEHAARRYEVVPLDLPPQERAYALASTFMPFVPEGYRSPLLPQTGVEAKRVTYPGADEAVELLVRPGGGVTVTYVLRLPWGDFLEKRTVTDGVERVLRVEAETCDKGLKLCVPTWLVERLGTKVLGSTAVTSVELNPELPQDFFAPKKPAGWP